MTTRIVAISLLLCSMPLSGQSLARGDAASAGMSAARLARIDTVMQGYVDSVRVPGIAILVLRDGRIVKSGVYGMADRESKQPLRADALYRIASQTKAVTSVATMMLVEQGRLRLGDPVSRWVPSFARATVMTDSGAVAVRRAITIRDLLTQTAGISYGTDAAVRDRYAAAGLGPATGYGFYFSDRSEPICASMDKLGELPFVAQPGERWVYGYATDLLGCVIERVSGQSLAQFFNSHIFAPLGMNDTYFFVPPAQKHRLATVYAWADNRLVRAPDGQLGQGSYVDGPRASYSGGAGLISTIQDYARFLQMLLNGGELNGARILSPHTIALMTADHVGEMYGRPGMGFGLGFEVLVDRGLAARYGLPGAYGWGGAYATNYWIDPQERIAALLMTQMIPHGGLDAADRFRTLVYSAIVEAR